MKWTHHIILGASLCLTPVALSGCDDGVNVEPLENDQVDETPANTDDLAQPPIESTPPAESTPPIESAPPADNVPGDPGYTPPPTQ